MNPFVKPLFIGLSPNISIRDVFLSCFSLVFPWNWKSLINGRYVKDVEKWIRKIFNVKYAFCFDSGRSSLFYALKALGISSGDKVLVQSYTCVVVINAILALGAKPKYIDISDDFCMDINDLSRKIDKSAKVIIIQHTFGKPANISKILEIAKKNNLKIIEDCAHSLGARYKKKLTGTFGDIGMLSFGSDKVVSSVRGGALITNNEELAEKLGIFSSRLPNMPLVVLIQHLIHYPVFYIGRKLYNLYIGKIILKLSRKLNIINKIIYNQEKHARQMLFFPCRLPNILAKILYGQLKNLNKINKHRQDISKIYTNNLARLLKIKLPEQDENSIFLRYTILVDEPEKLELYAKKKGIMLGDWYRTKLAPNDIDQTISEYKISGCVNADRISKKSINLPTNININENDARYISNVIINYFNDQD